MLSPVHKFFLQLLSNPLFIHLHFLVSIILFLISTSSTWFLLKATWSVHEASHCLLIWNSILYFFNQVNNGYVCGPWAPPHLFIVSIPPHGVSAFFQACWSLCAHCLTFLCNSHRPKLGALSSNLPLLPGELGMPKAPAQIPLHRGMPDLLSPIL